MDAQERAEIRELIEDILKPYNTEVIYQNKLTNLSLNNIDKRFDKLNGSVARHEKIINENLPHTVANCAQSDTIKEIRDMMIFAKKLGKISAWAIGIGVTLFGGYDIVKNFLH